MIRVLFVCLGNICRSPMAEILFKHIVNENNLSNKFVISSAGTSDEEEGNDIHYGTKEVLTKHNVPIYKRRARKINIDDYKKYDYIIVMEEKNIRDLKRIISDYDNKIVRLLDFTNNPRDISDPWYTGDFDATYSDIKEGLEAFLNYVITTNII